MKAKKKSSLGEDAVIQKTTLKGIVRLSTAGSVDDGKSTLIGRLLYDTRSIYQDHLEALRKASGKQENLSFHVLTDGLQAELEQGITIDVAYRYFETKNCRFILADAPGHERYTRNMATAASRAACTIVLVDVTRGITAQTKRHIFLASLLEVPRLLVAINKMDLVKYSQERFEELNAEIFSITNNLSFRDIAVIPISALLGDNIVENAKAMLWHTGPTILSYIESLRFYSEYNAVDFRFPVQTVLRDGGLRSYAGQIFSGSIKPGEEVVILPSGEKTRIKSIDKTNSQLLPVACEKAVAGETVALRLQDERDLGRGDMIVRLNNQPSVSSELEAILLWFDDTHLETGRAYILKQTTCEVKAVVSKLYYQIDVETLHRKDAQRLDKNDIGRCELQLSSALCFDLYKDNRGTGSFILIDPNTNQTAAAGLIIQRLDDRAKKKIRMDSEGSVSKNITREDGQITRLNRENILGHKSFTIWFTGLSGSGKSTLAKSIESELAKLNKVAYRLDGDNLRHGLNRDLGFGENDRSENVRRTAEVARILNDAGVVAICSLISPYVRDRDNARQVVGSEHFIEVYLSTPIEACEQRDVRGLYEKARKGEIMSFTGISAPYESPPNPSLIVDTTSQSIDETTEIVMRYLRESALL